ncbi:DUF4199 domain-containing protein [Maribellus mangrovi]|uniref:DUF4199 domain-containing protein n=1 Tax=Maribellus mangrovi TaxID=3133146 RepID=UPI0030EDD3D5
MKKIAVEIKWAILFVVVQLLWMLLERVSGLHDKNIEYHAVVTNFFALVAVAVYVFALLDKRKRDYDGKMNWIQGFISGLIITLGITLLTPLSQYLTVTVISPDYFEEMIDYSVSTGILSQEAAEAEFNLESYMIQSVLFAPIVGLITSAVVALFTRKK